MAPYRQPAVIVDPAAEARELAEFAAKVHSGASHVTPEGLIGGAITIAGQGLVYGALAIYARSFMMMVLALGCFALCVDNIRTWRRIRRR